MMIHWGLYSLLAGEWKDQRCGNYANGYRQDEFHKLSMINLQRHLIRLYFDADEIVKFAKDCEMKYIVFTSKHHEGFAIYHSKVDSFNIVDATRLNMMFWGNFSGLLQNMD